MEDNLLDQMGITPFDDNNEDGPYEPPANPHIDWADRRADGTFAPGHQVNAKPEHYTQISIRLEQAHINWLEAQPTNRSAVLRNLITKEMGGKQ